MHLCDTPLCVERAHLRAGTISENAIDMHSKGRHPQSRATHCLNGHEFDDANTGRVTGSGRRVCRACDRLKQKRYLLRRGGE